jgi:hypothetical protein
VSQPFVAITPPTSVNRTLQREFAIWSRFPFHAGLDAGHRAPADIEIIIAARNGDAQAL